MDRKMRRAGESVTECARHKKTPLNQKKKNNNDEFIAFCSNWTRCREQEILLNKQKSSRNFRDLTLITDHSFRQPSLLVVRAIALRS